MDDKSLDPVIRYCTVGRQLGYFTYLTLDSICFLDSAGIHRFKSSQKLAFEATRAWFLGLMFSIVGGAYTMYKVSEKEKVLIKTIAEGKVESEKLVKERQATITQLVSDLCDITIPATGLGYINFDDGALGLAGTVSNLIGLKAAWKRVA